MSFLGASGMVTGSCYLLTCGETKILIDCGMFQGNKVIEEKYNVAPRVNIGSLTAVLLTHAHLDHCGRIPLLIKSGYKGPIYMTEPTKMLGELVMFDAAKISREDSERMLYEDEDVIKTLELAKLVEYDKSFVVGGLEVTYFDAGHILGSASILIKELSTGKRIVFSGDLGNTPEPILSPTEWIKEADFAVMESTYGDEVHGKREEVEQLREIVNEAERIGGAVLIPSFSLQRSQELLYIFDGLKKRNEISMETPVFLDSPMAIKATNIFKDFPELYSKNVRAQARTDDPFDFPGLVLCDTVEKSKMIKNLSGVKVVIAGSGMMNGGRIIHHAINFLPEPSTQLVFVGFQAEGTLGREIRDGSKALTIWRNHVEVRAQIREIKTMSSHADQGQLLYWMSKIKGLSKVMLVHGEEMPRLVLKEKIKQGDQNIEVGLPHLEDEIEL